MSKKTNKIHQPHDKGYKYILKTKKEFLELLKGFVHEEWVSSIREEDIVRIDKSFIDTHFQTKEADIVYRYQNGGEETIFYVLLEHQSSVDKRMMFRLLLYMVEIWRDHLTQKKLFLSYETEQKAENEKDFTLPAIIPIILYTGNSEWKAPTQFKELIPGAKYFQDHILNFRSLMIDTSVIDDEEFLQQESVVSLVLYLDKVKNLKEFITKFVIARIFYKELTESEKKLFNKWLKEVFPVRFKGEVREKVEKILNETDQNEVDKMMTNIERILNEEMDKRYLDGRSEGKEELLWRQLRKKFPTLDKSYYERLKKLNSDQLDIFSLDLLDISKLSELDRYL
ncbi:MAG TPA: Rpn family recombination-promoting nuclease/putative transposase [Thermotogota bacterium]|nr:Rpn family recombination-promoting nuclease/putative transposase [Thermotogota bacterium]